MKTYFVALFSLVMSLTACGSGSSSDGSSTENNGTTPAGTCEAASARICQRACACATDGKCRVATKTDGGLTATINFENEEKCRNLYVTLGCLGGGTAALDYGTCDSAVVASSCVAGAGGAGILLPDSCKSAQ